MKKVIILVVLLSTVLFGCKNTTAPEFDNEPYKENTKQFILQIPQFYLDDKDSVDFVNSVEKIYADLERKGEVEKLFGNSNLELEIGLMNGTFFEKDSVIGIAVFVANNSGKDIDSFSMDMELQVEGYPKANISSKNVGFEHEMVGTMKSHSIMPLKVLLPCQNFKPTKTEFSSKEMQIILKNIKVNYH
ncbi:hypothetical protein HB799_06055 [Listeria welshimeri]|nr:hypothetical protein [Listeria welshimeri]MBC1770690.1 hypothetical protein [Listeria welshimeri]